MKQNALIHTASTQRLATSELAGAYKRYKAALIASYLSRYGPGNVIERRVIGGICCYLEPLAPGQSNPTWEAVYSGVEKRLTRPDFLDACEFYRKTSNLNPSQAELVLLSNGGELQPQFRRRAEVVEKFPYVRRNADQQLVNALFDDKAPLSVQSAKGRGKTRLLRRTLAVARALCFKTAFLDFGQIGKFVTPASLYGWMGLQIRGQMGLGGVFRWRKELPPAQAFSLYLQEQIFPNAHQGFILGIDNCDRLLEVNSDVGIEFLQFVKSINQIEKIKLILTYTNKLEENSSFKTGVLVQAGRLSPQEVGKLAGHYQVNLTEEELIDTMRQSKGHPPTVHALLSKLSLYANN